MSRKNIFEMVADIFDISIELNRMFRLVEKKGTIYFQHHTYTLRDYIKYYGFPKWRNRGRCVDLTDFLTLLNYDDLWTNAQTDVQDLFTLIEIVYNFWYIADQTVHASNRFGDDGKDFLLLKKIMDDCLAHYNYKAEYFPDLEQAIVIEDKPEATAVAEIVDNETGYKVLRYNHYMLKGDLQAKKDILLALGANLEPKRKQLQTIDKDLEDGIFYILNNLHLRHNNKCKGDKNYKQAVADMDAETLETWYDELYQMILLAYLQLDQVDRNAKVKALKQAVSPK
jgi:hypothetical protein